MPRLRMQCAAALAILIGVGGANAVKLPDGYWSEKKTAAILEKTVTIYLDPDLSHLSDSETRTVQILLEAGQVMHELYEMSQHHQALSSHRDLQLLDRDLGEPRATQNLLDLYRLFKGPIGRDLDGKVLPFLPVDGKAWGRNVYPWGIEKAEIDAYLAGQPDERGRLLNLRTVVRRADEKSLQKDLEMLQRYPVLQVLHPHLKEGFERLLEAPEEGGFYAAPYSVAFADRIMKLYGLLNDAADAIEKTDIEYARYLRHRAVDLLRDDYEAGDAAWVMGRFKNLNSQIGSYETYDDELYGVKSFFSLSLLVKDPVMSESVNGVVGWLQEMENNLPYDNHKTVRQDIPVGVYNVIADFGQARGTNTATILPNESYITQKYGRTILLRYNIMTHPELFGIRQAAFNAAVHEDFHDAYDPKGDFFRTLWHEVGHYLGPDLDRHGRTLDIALEEDSSILEELKADLVSLFGSKMLHKRGYYDMTRLRALQASGVRRVLRKNKPRKTQTYATMELMQMNYYLEHGLLTYDRKANKLRIDYAKYHPTVEAMLRDVLALQQNGDKQAADEFIAKYTAWEDNVHGRLANAMKNAETYRYALVRYGALGEAPPPQDSP